MRDQLTHRGRHHDRRQARTAKQDEAERRPYGKEGEGEGAGSSIQEIRGLLVDKQVELSHLHDGSLYLLIEYMAEGIRQFLTFTETGDSAIPLESQAHMRAPDVRERYFGALQVLRVHIHSCLTQVARIAEMETPKVEAYLRSKEEWHRFAYIRPPDLPKVDRRA